MQMNLRSKKGGIETRLLHMFSDQCTKLHFDKILFTDHLEIKPVHRGWISQFLSGQFTTVATSHSPDEKLLHT